MKLVEESSGSGALLRDGEPLRFVRYRIQRYQGFSPSGMPVPGLFRIDGSIESGQPTSEDDVPIGCPLLLKLEDGRTVSVTLLDARGRIGSEGHGPSKCLCC